MFITLIVNATEIFQSKVAPFVQKSFYKKKGRKWKYNKHTAKSIALWFLLL